MLMMWVCKLGSKIEGARWAHVMNARSPKPSLWNRLKGLFAPKISRLGESVAHPLVAVQLTDRGFQPRLLEGSREIWISDDGVTVVALCRDSMDWVVQSRFADGTSLVSGPNAVPAGVRIATRISIGQTIDAVRFQVSRKAEIIRAISVGRMVDYVTVREYERAAR